jgi:hypothetical protein
MKLIIAKNLVSLDELANVGCPAATESFQPIPHFQLVETARRNLQDAGFQVIAEEHATARYGLRYFGGFAVTGTEISAPDRTLVVGLRNSHDKGFAASICLGNRMTVCENLCFSANIKLARRHTTFILRDINAVIARAIGRLADHFGDMGRRIDLYKSTGITRATAAELAYALATKGALPPRDIYSALQEWEAPRHPEFGGNTLWTLYNAVTENLKGGDLSKLPDRTMTMQSVFDALCGMEDTRVIDVDSLEVTGLDVELSTADDEDE